MGGCVVVVGHPHEPRRRSRCHHLPDIVMGRTTGEAPAPRLASPREIAGATIYAMTFDLLDDTTVRLGMQHTRRTHMPRGHQDCEITSSGITLLSGSLPLGKKEPLFCLFRACPPSIHRGYCPVWSRADHRTPEDGLMTAFAHLSILPRGKTKSHEQRHDGQHTCASDARRCGVGTKLTAWPPPLRS